MVDIQLQGEYETVAGIQAEREDDLLSKNNVVGVGVGHKISGGQDTGDTSLTVLVSQKVDSALLDRSDRIPKTVGKFKTDVVDAGILFAGGSSDLQLSPTKADAEIQSLRQRSRPVEGGFSVGHPKVTAGTYGTAVIDRTPFPGIPQRYYILSNNHVLANSNDAQLGDPIYQPGVFDGGLPSDTVARLSRFVPIKFDGTCNYVDAAIAEGPFEWLDREIYWIGYVQGVRSAQVGDIVQKTGRTTNYTTGRVLTVNTTTNVNYGGGKVAKMCRQIVTTAMSAGGDSGSLTCDMDGNAVGLLFAGSSQVTIHNHIGFVLGLLNIRIP